MIVGWLGRISHQDMADGKLLMRHLKKEAKVGWVAQCGSRNTSAVIVVD